MLSRPRLKSHLRVAAIPDEGVYVLSSAKQVLLRGRLYYLVVPLLNGSTTEEICERLSEHASPAEVFYTLGMLEKKGFLAETHETLSDENAAWWSMQQVDPGTAEKRLAQKSVTVCGLGVDVQPLCQLLQASGVQISHNDDAALAVAVVDHYLKQDLAIINRSALERGRCWLLAKPLGPQLWLGPLFQPGKTGCWQCLAERLQSHRAVEGYLHRKQTLNEPLMVESPGPASAVQLGWSLTANAITTWVARGELPDCEGKIRTFDQHSWNVSTHTLFKLPFCPECGDLKSDRVHSESVDDNGQTLHGLNSDGLHVNSQSHNGSSDHRNSVNRSGANAAKIKGHASTHKNGKTHVILPNENAAPTPQPEVHQRTLKLDPLILKSRTKGFDRDGGHRIIAPEATLERYGHHVSPITGAVSMLQRISPDGDQTMHVYLAGHNLARRHSSLKQLKSDLRNMSAGKGATDAQAKASGLCEGLERYSGVFRGDEPRFKARLQELDGAGIDVRDCLLFSERQYADRDTINARKSMYNFVPAPYDPQSEIDWTSVWSLTRQETRFLPSAFCYYDFPDPSSQRFCIACSNGCAAGNTLEEAILQGFFELVERDSVALWWYNRVSRPGVDLASFNEPYIPELQESLAKQDREMHVLDLTSDLEIPVFAAWSRSLRQGPEQILLGFGAHLDARIAMLRAVTEMIQMMSHLHRNPLEDGDVTLDVTDAETVHWLRTATIDNQPYLKPDPATSPRTAKDFLTTCNDDFVDDIADCRRRVERNGLEMLVLNQTRPEIGLPVAKVIVPGLRHFWARFGAGRLYDIPVQLGWRSSPIAEDELNPIPMFL
nr:hypothetical protein Hi04_10k_c5016_00041 [uncultured bacterium]